MATQAQKFKKIKQEASKSDAKPFVKTAAKLTAAYSDLSAKAKKQAMAVIDKAYDTLTSEKGAAKIPTSFKELYARFVKEYKGDNPKGAWKEGTKDTRDVKKDAGRPALKKGKRTVKMKGYTTNQYGKFKNKVGSTYYESRSNRIDVNTPVVKKKVKLAYGGMAKNGTMTKSKKGFQMPTNAEFNRMSEKQQKEVFMKWADSQGIMDINDPNFMFANGGGVKKVVTKKYAIGGEFGGGGATGSVEKFWNGLSSNEKMNWLKKRKDIPSDYKSSLSRDSYEKLPDWIKAKVKKAYADNKIYRNGSN